MANTPGLGGLIPVRYLNGAPWNGATNLYFVPSTDTSQYSVGDPVAAVAGDDGGAGGYGYNVPQVGIGVAGSVIRGVIASIVATTQSSPSGNIPATKSQGYYLNVIDDPNVLFMIQENSTATSGTPLTSAAVGANGNFVIGEPSQTFQPSNTMINNSSVTTTSTLNLRLIGLAAIPNNTYGPYAKWLVKINNHDFSAGTTGL